MFLLRKLVLCCSSNNILFKAYHVPGVHNLIPDKLSRSHVQEARQLAPWLDPTPTLRFIQMATDLAQSGVPDQDIQARGRWHSNAFTLYIRIQTDT